MAPKIILVPIVFTLTFGVSCTDDGENVGSTTRPSSVGAVPSVESWHSPDPCSLTDAELRAQILGYGQISRTPIFRGCDWRVKQTDRSLTVIVREGIHYTGVRDLRRNSDKADEIYRQLTDKGCVPLKVLIATACWQRRAVEGMSVHLRKSDVVTTVQIQYRDLGSKDSQKLSALAQKVAQHVSKGM